MTDRAAQPAPSIAWSVLRKPDRHDLNHQMCSFDVPVHYSGFVRLEQPGSDLDGWIESLFDRERAARDALLQRLAIVEGHRDKEPVVGRFADFIDGTDIRVIERRGLG